MKKDLIDFDTLRPRKKLTSRRAVAAKSVYPIQHGLNIGYSLTKEQATKSSVPSASEGDIINIYYDTDTQDYELSVVRGKNKTVLSSGLTDAISIGKALSKLDLEPLPRKEYHSLSVSAEYALDLIFDDRDEDDGYEEDN